MSMIDRKHLSQRIAFGTFRLLSLTVVGYSLPFSALLYIKV